MTNGFNMFLDVELIDLAALITRASWAVDPGPHRPVPSALAQKTKTERKKPKSRTLSHFDALSNLHKGLSTLPGSLKR